jgi:hypothetical protein
MRHLKESGMSYVQHCSFALRVALALTIAILALLVHAFFPFWFEKTASSIVDEVNKVINRTRK